MISEINQDFLDNISDEHVKQVLILLLNKVETQEQTIKELTEENRRLKDEVNRLKGEKGKPVFSGKKGAANSSHSTEQERKENKSWHKEPKKDQITIDRQVQCDFTEEELKKLPEDARFLRYERRVQQNLKLVRENTEYKVAVYHSASTRKIYYVPMPEDYQGGFGADLKSLVHVMTHVCDVTRSKLLELFHTVGIQISSGSINNILLEQAEAFEKERAAILQAGLKVSRYIGMDSTGSKQKGISLYTQIINSELFSVYSSHPKKNRLTILAVLQDTDEALLSMTYNTEARELFDVFLLGEKDKTMLSMLFEQDRIYSRAEVEKIVTDQMPAFKTKQLYPRLLEALAIGYYHSQTTYPIVNNLLSDDAGEYKRIAWLMQALCWVHDGRFYKKLTPFVQANREILDAFSKQYWEFYRSLLDYKADFNETNAIELEKKFDQLFTQQTSYDQLNERIKETYANKEKLLAVLKCPFIPLHNNASELAARRIVIKRKISLHTISETGTNLRDAAMSIVETCKKLKVNVIDYLTDRVSGSKQMPDLASLIINSP